MTRKGYKAEKKPGKFSTIKDRQEAYKEVFGKGLGAMVLEDLLIETAVHRTAFAGNAEQTNYNLGKQHIGYHITNLLQLNLTEVLLDD